jgi:uncharacterized DUF497 family protein
MTVFFDPLALSIPDPVHSEEEFRQITIGWSVSLRQLVVVHADENDKIRLISARLATAREKRIYEEGSR